MDYKIGLALGGGAARGWSHIGVIEALAEAGIVPAVVAGTSMGALVGGAYAAGRLERLSEWARKADRRAVASLVDVNLSAGGLISGQRIQNFLVDIGLGGAIESLPIPYAAVATHLLDGREIWLQDGSLDGAIRASIAMPGIISPYNIDGRWLSDGGLVNPIPVSTCRALGADFIIAVGVGEGLMQRHAAPLRANGETRSQFAEMIAELPVPLRVYAQRLLPQRESVEAQPPGYFSVLAIALNVMQEKITRSRLAGEPPHAMIAPQVAHVRLLDFDQAEAAIAAGREAAKHAIAGIERQLHG